MIETTVMLLSAEPGGLRSREIEGPMSVDEAVRHVDYLDSFTLPDTNLAQYGNVGDDGLLEGPPSSQRSGSLSVDNGQASIHAYFHNVDRWQQPLPVAFKVYVTRLPNSPPGKPMEDLFTGFIDVEKLKKLIRIVYGYENPVGFIHDNASLDSN